MKEKIALCGFRCDLCPGYKENVTGTEGRQEASDGWFKFYGFRVPQEEICCDGCPPPDAEDARIIDAECPVRPCVLERGIPNCAHCDEYVCDKLRERLVDPDAVVKRVGAPVPQDEFDRFIKPYDNKNRLAAIRKQIGKEDV
jgi:hypothetical protein